MVLNFQAYPLFCAKRKTLKEKSFKVYSAKIIMSFQQKADCTVTFNVEGQTLSSSNHPKRTLIYIL